MPRQVDHDSRRRTIAEAVCALADRDGLEGVTLRDVAEEAGVSMGAVQRCFRTKDEMLVFALSHVSEQVAARIRRAHSLGRVAAEIALLTEGHRAQARVWLAFAARAAVSPPLAAVLRAHYAEAHALLTRLIQTTGDEDRNGAGDAAERARTLLALADGLTAHVLIGHLTPHAAQAVLDHHLATAPAR
ncbi:TetR family transcriptional regulator C-terminal domain-containing protein [Streptomyces carpaticus]|uniref:TetR/AcrR family transcriptional regulator n=1 Tax=Streptomyces TaxID=1883 RepID=UPI002208FC5E|nr:TetR family transcriptional regulator C-terminal domain-containing protein [Streptomyces carpaticus]